MPESPPADSASVASHRPVVAFFDVDNTLLRGASIYHLGRGARRRGVLTLRDLLRFTWHQTRFVAVGENGRHLIGARERALKLIRGHTEDELRAIAEEVFDDYIAPKLWPETVELTREHLRNGHEVWLITATPVVIARVIAAKLGVSGALGTDLEIVDGSFTGELLGPLMHGTRKADAATELATRVGADVADCWAYSDSNNDLPLLTLVGNRTVVNPDVDLSRHAKANGWSMLRLKPSSIRAASRRVRREARAARRARPTGENPGHARVGPPQSGTPAAGSTPPSTPAPDRPARPGAELSGAILSSAAPSGTKKRRASRPGA